MPVASVPYLTRRGFASTHWTTVRACAGNDSFAQEAREEICRDYWYPTYAYIKRLGHPSHDAAELTQDFFAYILGREWFAHADSTRGKFRSFLLASLHNFLHDDSDRKKRWKRQGAYQHVPLDLENAASRYAQSEASHTHDPGKLYEVEWASTIVAVSLERLEQEHATTDKYLQYQELGKFLMTEGDASRYEAAAIALGISAANVKVLVHRLRQRYKAILREQVARTVATPGDVEEEMRHLRSVLASS